MVFSLLKGMGNIIVHVGGVKSLLLDLLERRNKYHFGLDKVQQKLSKTEIETLCLLLEVILVVLPERLKLSFHTVLYCGSSFNMPHLLGCFKSSIYCYKLIMFL